MPYATLKGQTTIYDASQLSVTNGTTNYDVQATGGMFDNVKEAHFVEIRTTYNISIKLNSTDNDSIQIKSTDSPYSLDPTNSGMIIHNIFITNASGSTAVIDIFIS
jgi:hypothetical protein